MFRAHVFIVRRAKLYYTVSGIITAIGSHPVHGTATYSCDDTRDGIIQFCPPDDEHMCSKHIEAWNKLITKFIASSWLILINKQLVNTKATLLSQTIMRHIEHIRLYATYILQSYDERSCYRTCQVFGGKFVVCDTHSPFLIVPCKRAHTTETTAMSRSWKKTPTAMECV
jgi:hypothetical protein